MNWHPKTPTEAAQLLDEIEKRAVGAQASSCTRVAEVRLNELALFAGGGGGLLASRLLGWNTVCAVEINPYRQAVLLARQADGVLDPFPIWDDVRSFDGRPWRGLVDIVTAGFPCQPFSVAGKRKGKDDSRNGWPDTIRIIGEVKPRFALLENVPGLLMDPYIHEIFGQLAESGYDARWRVLSAAELGAPHRRDRLWIAAVANAGQTDWGRDDGALADATRVQRNGSKPDGEQPRGSALESRDGSCKAILADTGQWNGRRGTTEQHTGSWWTNDPADENPTAESFVGRVADGVANRMDQHGADGLPFVPRVAEGVQCRIDRLAALGDGQVPAVVRAAWELLIPELFAPEGKP